MNEVNPLKTHTSSFSTIESKLKEYPIIAFDTEDDSKGTPLLFSFYGDFPAKEFVTKHWEEALDFIYEVEDTSIFVAHNLEYDVANLFKQSDYLMVDKMLYASSLLKVDLYGTKHFMLNTHSFFKGSLAKMGEFVGVEKLEGDALSEAYVIQDAKIAYTFTKMFQEKLVKEVGVNLSVTIGKMAMDTYRRSHMIKKKQITYNSPNCLKAYYGGRVEIFKKGITKDIKVTDINSAYPFVMKEYDYPDTASIEPSSIKTHKYGIGRFDMYVPPDTFLPVLPYKSPDKRLFFPVGNFSGWWTYQEVRYAIEMGATIVKEYEGEGTNRGCRPFESFIDTYYEKRQECKTRLQKNPDDTQATFDSLFYKFWLNNLYGKWCQHKDGVEMTRDKWPDFKLDKLRETPGFKETKIGCFYNYTVPKTELPKTANFMWGIYVTSYARIYLHKGLQAVHNSGHSLLYCDTDSVMYSANNDSVPFNITNNLGDWDIEKFDLGIFRQAKGYLLCDKENSDYIIKKVACKGVPTNYAYDFIVDGMAKIMKPYRMKEALIRINAKANKGNDEFLKDIGENVWHDVAKEMKSIYVKRKGDIITYPVTLDEMYELEQNTYLAERSIDKELKKNGINIKNNRSKNNFENTVVPDGYFVKVGKGRAKPRLLLSQKIFTLRSEQCLELNKGQIWFKGDVLQNRTTKNGKKLYHLFITHYKGTKLTANFWGTIPVKFLEGYGLTENMLNKTLAIKMSSIYLLNSSLDLSIEVSESKLKGQIDTENLDESTLLTENELKNLMSFDWSTICQPNSLKK